MRVEIDKNSGFCFGVVNAIERAEEALARGPLYCIGDIVHNSKEVDRLKKKGLVTIDHATFSQLSHCRVLFRAHGEPPASYLRARESQVEVIDASCPVVLNLQKQIRQAYERHRPSGGQVVIYGKPGHAEVTALVAQIGGDAIVVETEQDLANIDFRRPVVLFSQTTRSLEGFRQIVTEIGKRAGLYGTPVELHDTICRKVANRIPQLRLFAAAHDVVLFVTGEKSSNGMQLFAVCREINPRSYLIHGAEDLRPEMTAGAESVGISGATSTPGWVMEEVMEKLTK